MRVTRPRKDFGHEGGSYAERDAAGESTLEIKTIKGGIVLRKKVLELGL